MLFCCGFIFLIDVSPAEGISEWTKSIECKLDKSGREYAIDGLAIKNQVILWAGLEQDNVPWIELFDFEKLVQSKLSFVDEISRRVITPSKGQIDKAGEKLVFSANWSVGLYNFKTQHGQILKSITLGDLKNEDELLANIKWFSDKEVIAFSYENWGKLKVLDITNKELRIAYSSPSMFIADYNVGPAGELVVAMGPANKQLIRAEITPGAHDIDFVRSDKINLYLLKKDALAVVQLTDGRWYDFAPKISLDNRYVAFLRGKKRIKEPRYAGKEYSLSNTGPALYVYDLKTKEERRLISNSLLSTSFDFQWQTAQTILYRISTKNGTAIISNDVKSMRYKELYRTCNIILSFWYSEEQDKLVLIERSHDEDYLIVLDRSRK